MAREILPPEALDPNADPRDLDLDVTRERLDGAPLAGWRAPLAAWVERLGEWLGAPATPETSSAYRADTQPRRLTSQQKAGRAAALALAIVVTLFMLLDGAAATRNALGALDLALHPPQPTPTISDSGYHLQRLPPTAQHQSHISIAPAANISGVAFGCWIDPFTRSQDFAVGALAVYRTYNGGENWVALRAPSLQAADCTVVTDIADPSGALLIVEPSYYTYGVCETPRLFVTHDSGLDWSDVLWPASIADTPCGDYQYTLAGNAVYLQDIAQGISRPLSATARGLLLVTRDGGASWAAADNGLQDINGLNIVAYRYGGGILASEPDVAGAPGASRLVESRDYGATWRSLGDLPGAFPAVFASQDTSLGTDWGQLYVLARPLVGGAPANDITLVLATATTGSRWTTIPLPPLISGDESGSSQSTPSPLGVGPGGALFLERGVVSTNDRSQLTPPRRLWAWSPTERRWLLDPDAVPSDIDELDWSWNAGDLTVWLTSLQLGVPPTMMLFTRVYTRSSVES
ncbi:MAG TPA: hypothetical protein VF808_05970 [Ktedonobacterales bacterium]